MRLRMLGTLVCGLMLYGLAGAGFASAQVTLPGAAGVLRCGAVTTAPTYKHVIFILEENHSYGSIYQSASAPYINKVIALCGSATNYQSISHPSLPNYIGLTDGAGLGALRRFWATAPHLPPASRARTTSSTRRTQRVVIRATPSRCRPRATW